MKLIITLLMISLSLILSFRVKDVKFDAGEVGLDVTVASLHDKYTNKYREDTDFYWYQKPYDKVIILDEFLIDKSEDPRRINIYINKNLSPNFTLHSQLNYICTRFFCGQKDIVWTKIYDENKTRVMSTSSPSVDINISNNKDEYTFNFKLYSLNGLKEIDPYLTKIIKVQFLDSDFFEKKKIELSETK